MKKSLFLNNEVLFAFASIFLMLLALPLRLINLNYNSAFNDEAIYIIVGLMGIFERDWWTYNASAWIPGVQYFYPSITAIAYNIGGIVGSRFINVFLSIFTIQIIFLLTTAIFQKANKLKTITLSQIASGTIAALVIGGSEVAHYISRLATYDMPSFMFLFLGILLLIETKPVTAGNRYFLASIFLTLSYFAKIITGMYLPFIALIFYFQTKKLSPINHAFYKQYFMFPLISIFAIFTFFSLNSLFGYFTNQQSLNKAELIDIPLMIWEKAHYPIIFGLIGAIGLLLKKQFGLLLTLTSAALLIVLFHIATNRTLSMDKHLFLLISFLSIIAGLGIANILVFISLIYYWVGSYQNLELYNNKWSDMSVLSQPIKENVKSGDKILAESGSAIILEAYYNNFPPNTSTFDWLQYRNRTGDQAFEMAVKDGYFDLIQLESEQNSKSDTNARLSNLVRKNMDTNYQLIFEQGGFLLYRRVF